MMPSTLPPALLALLLPDGLPANLQAITYQACAPCIAIDGECDVTLEKRQKAAFAADILPHLIAVMAIKVHLHNPQTCRIASTLDNDLMHAYSLHGIARMHAGRQHA